MGFKSRACVSSSLVPTGVSLIDTTLNVANVMSIAWVTEDGVPYEMDKKMFF